MFDYIHGLLIESHTSFTIVEAGGIGYKIHTPINLSFNHASLGTKIKLFVTEVIREDSHDLYGFLYREERELFLLVSQVSGIGPKTALALIGHNEPTTLIDAIACENISLLICTPGIGKKTAERLIVEMKDRIKKLPIASTSNSKKHPHLSDGVSALLNLGYPLITAQKAVEKALEQIDQENDLGALIKQALANIN